MKSGGNSLLYQVVDEDIMIGVTPVRVGEACSDCREL